MTTAMFVTLAEYCTLAPHHAQTWWTALTQAQWSEARSWRQALQYFDARPVGPTAKLDAVLPFLRQTSPPARVVRVLEALVQEKRLSRGEASAIEEQVLRCVNCRGEWFWSY